MDLWGSSPMSPNFSSDCHTTPGGICRCESILHTHKLWVTVDMWQAEKGQCWERSLLWPNTLWQPWPSLWATSHAAFFIWQYFGAKQLTAERFNCFGGLLCVLKSRERKKMSATLSICRTESKRKGERDMIAGCCFYATLPSAGTEREHLEEFSCR